MGDRVIHVVRLFLVVRYQVNVVSPYCVVAVFVVGLISTVNVPLFDNS